jgi:four helix bundle protein
MEVLYYKDLVVWQKAMDLVVLVYQLTESFPKTEMYGLVSQMRRSAVSIPSNIAEGKTRSTKKDYRYFILNAYSSGAELETQVLISKRLMFIKVDVIKLESLLDEVMRMLNSLSYKLRT